MGVYPKPILDRSRDAVMAIHERVVKQAGGTVEHAEAVSEPAVAEKKH
jgi:hypothetical protein